MKVLRSHASQAAVSPTLRVGVRRFHRELRIGIGASPGFSGRIRAHAVVRDGRTVRGYRRSSMIRHGRGRMVLRVAPAARIVRLVVRFDGSPTFSRQRVVIVSRRAQP